MLTFLARTRAAASLLVVVSDFGAHFFLLLHAVEQFHGDFLARRNHGFLRLVLSEKGRHGDHVHLLGRHCGAAVAAQAAFLACGTAAHDSAVKAGEEGEEESCRKLHDVDENSDCEGLLQASKAIKRPGDFSKSHQIVSAARDTISLARPVCHSVSSTVSIHVGP